MTPPRSRRRRRHLGLRRVPPIVIRPGAIPGSIEPLPNAQPTAARWIRYDSGSVDEGALDREDPLPDGGARSVVWLDVVGLGDVDWLRELGQRFALHPLLLEDVVSAHQLPKLEVYDGSVFVVLRMPRPDEGPGQYEQVSLVLGESWVLTFQEREGDCFGPVRDRVRSGRGRIREAGADYLAYALVDAVVDRFFPLLEGVIERLEDIEDDLLDGTTSDPLPELLEIRRRLIRARRSAEPLREVVTALRADTTPFITDTTRVFLRDCLDHTALIADRLESQREVAGALVDIHLGLSSQRLNEVMRLLTIFSTLFLPLGFLAGVYGMNFDPSRSPFNMPETQWAYGYPTALLAMATVAGALLLWFRTRGWIGRNRRL